MYLKTWTKQGFSLIELAVSMGLVGGVTLAAMKVMEDQSSNDAISRYKAEVQKTVLMVQRSLNNPSRCTEMLQGKVITPSGTNLPNGLILNPADPARSTVLIRPGNVGSVRLTSLQVATSTFSNSSFDIRMTFTPQTAESVIPFFNSGRATITKTITLVGSLNAANVIQSCGPVVSESDEVSKKALCDGLSTTVATWNSSTKRCTLNLSNFKCPHPQVPTRLTRLGAYVCESIATQVDYSKIFDFNPVSCPTKQFALYLLPDGKISIGCPTAAQKAGPRPVWP